MCFDCEIEMLKKENEPFITFLLSGNDNTIKYFCQTYLQTFQFKGPDYYCFSIGSNRRCCTKD